MSTIEYDSKKRSRGWCITDFILDNSLWDRFIDEAKHDYLIIGLEVCPETKKSHLQVYLHFKEARSWSSVRKYFNPRHIEPARGSPESNQIYCSKEKNFKEWGKCPQQGERCDLDEVRERIKAGISEREIAEANFAKYCQYGRAFERYRLLVEKGRDWVTEVHCLWGVTGTGKTRGCIELIGHKDYGDCSFSGSKTSPFVLGFHGQEDLLFDDFDPTTITLECILKMTDRHKCTVNIKNGQRNFAPKKIYFTANNDPRMWWGGAPQWVRRLTSCKFFGKIDTEVSTGNTKAVDNIPDLPDSESFKLKDYSEAALRKASLSAFSMYE